MSKAQNADALREAYDAGQRDFGESYAQEALDKMKVLSDLPICWHFIGPLQSNKTRPVAEAFDWVHSVDRLKIAERLAAQRPAGHGALNICLQINVSGEASKSGVPPEEAKALALAIATLPQLRLRGLMAIPEPSSNMALTRRRFEVLSRLRDELNRDGLALDTLSMGMSEDLELAIAAGSTMVRVGTAIFGARPSRSTAA